MIVLQPADSPFMSEFHESIGPDSSAEVGKKLDELFARLNGPASVQVKNTAAGEQQPEVCHA